MSSRLTQCGTAFLLVMAGGATVATISCNRDLSSPSVKFGERQNAERKKLGLPLVDPTWDPTTLDYQTFVWSLPMGYRRGVPAYYDKLVTFDGRELIEEVDFYTNGRWASVQTAAAAGTQAVTPASATKPDNRGSQSSDAKLVTLVIHFSYDRSARGLDPWSCALTEGGGDTEMTLPEAEKLLATWGLKRLNY